MRSVREAEWPKGVENPLDIWSSLPLCGCGKPDAAIEVWRWLLEREAFKTDGDMAAIHTFIEQSDQLEQHLSPHPGVFYALLYALDHAELTEHGGSVHAGWLTPKGERVLAFLRVFGGRPDDWPKGLRSDESGGFYELTDEQAERLRGELNG